MNYKSFVLEKAYSPATAFNYSLLRSTVGLAAEYSEFLKAESYEEQLSEAGDVWFWLTSSPLDLNLHSLGTDSSDLSGEEAVILLIDVVEKATRSQGLRKPDYLENIERLYLKVACKILTWLHDNNLSISQLEESNRAKLEKRHANIV